MKRIECITSESQLVERMSKLSEKERKFVINYVKSANLTKSALRAGISVPTAKRFLESKRAKKAIKYYVALECERYGVDKDSVLKFYQATLNANLSDYVTWDDFGNIKLVPMKRITPEQMACVDELYRSNTGILKVKLKDKMKAADSLARYLGLFKDTLKLVTDNDSASLDDYDLTKLSAKELRVLRKILEKAKK